MIFNTVVFGLLAIAGLAQAAPTKRQVNQGDGECFFSYSMYVKNSYHVEATFFEPGLGSCGINSSAADHIVAMSASFFDTFP
jgi:hypothetical protein